MGRGSGQHYIATLEVSPRDRKRHWLSRRRYDRTLFTNRYKLTIQIADRIQITNIAWCTFWNWTQTIGCRHDGRIARNDELTVPERNTPRITP